MYSVVLVSSVQQSDSDRYIYLSEYILYIYIIYIFSYIPFITGYYKILNL